MNRNMVRGSIVLIVLIGIAIVFLLIDKDTETITVYNPPSEEVFQKKIRDDLAAKDVVKPPPPGETEDSGYWHGDHWHETSPGKPETEDTPGEAVKSSVNVPYPRGQTSSNPLLADGVPEHLKCPPKWIGVQGDDLSEVEKEEVRTIFREIIEKYNPKRPLADIWSAFIEAEKFYYANNVISTHTKGSDGLIPIDYTPIGPATERVDWMLQHALDYPEIVELSFKKDYLFDDVRLVEIGREHPDWNKITLPDRRTFREKSGYYYEFTYYEGKGHPDPNDPHIHGYNGTLRTIRTGHSGKDATLVKIHLNDTSDEELEALSGWDFNINPYTQEAIRK